MIDSLEYNTERTGLIIPEYGRHIQKMVDQAISCPDKNERNKMAFGKWKLPLCVGWTWYFFYYSTDRYLIYLADWCFVTKYEQRKS